MTFTAIARTAILIFIGTTATGAHAEMLRRDNGAAVGDNQNSQTAGPTGPVLLQDVHLIEKLQRFDRERIPERVVHARGTGAFGEFVSSADSSALTRAAPFAEAGKVTPVFVRFSTVIHGVHSPETLRDPRGFATKFYTDEGNWDLVGNNLPVFFIRDAIKFPDMVHSLKPSPITNLQDPNRFFDFFSHQPESTHMLTQVYSDLGTPASYREMDGNGVHAYKFVTVDGEVSYVKFNWRSQQGVRTLDADQVRETQGRDFNHLTSDLYGAIRRGEFPSWDLYVQVLRPDQLDDFSFDPLDATKIWPDVPAVKLGRMTLNAVPNNFFQATEQSAFAPSNLIPGIEPSEDRLLQGRIFSYADTQLYRLGANHKQLPINAPRSAVANHNQDGFMRLREDADHTNYQPSRGPNGHTDDRQYAYSQLALSGRTQQQGIARTDNFSQAGAFWRALPRQAQDNLIRNLAGDLGAVQDATVKHTLIAHFHKADPDYGRRLGAALKADRSEAERIAATL